MRKSTTITITAEGRDKGKSFQLTEMAASRAEKWATRALMMLARSGADLSDSTIGAGLEGMARVGLTALFHAPFHEAEPLLDEMMSCIEFVPDRNKPQIPTRPLIEDDIEEVATRVRLRLEVFDLHTGFTLAASLLTSDSVAKAATG